MLYLKELESIRDEMISRKEDIEKELRMLPEGYLYEITARSGKRYYYERLPKSAKRIKEKRIALNKESKSDMLRGLVRKSYLTKAIRAIDLDINLMNKLLSNYEPSDENGIMREFLEARPELGRYVYSVQMNGDEWARDYQPASDMFDDDLKAVSADGTSMRSMAEIAISSRLERYDIPYRYEAPLGIPDYSFVPDFTIKRPRDGMIIYWEHLGLVSDEDYMRNNSRKFEIYREYGIVPWKNLIVTYGNEKGGINMKIIDAMIKGWFL